MGCVKDSGNAFLKELFFEVVQELSCYCEISLLPTSWYCYSIFKVRVKVFSHDSPQSVLAGDK